MCGWLNTILFIGCAGLDSCLYVETPAEAFDFPLLPQLKDNSVDSLGIKSCLICEP